MSTEATQDPTTPAAAAATLYPGEEAYEEEHVHSVYEQIASHFSSTRYKVGTSSTSNYFSLSIISIIIVEPIPFSSTSRRKK